MDLEFWFAPRQRKPAADNGRGAQHTVDIGQDDGSRRGSARPEATRALVARKKTRRKR
jgi:hypothetical protein